MSGVICVNDGNTWIPPGWIYDGVLERIAAEIRDTHPALSEQLTMATTSESVGYLDLTAVEADALAVIEAAASQVRVRLLADGARSFRDPSFFPAFIRRLDELLTMLRSDSRLAARPTP